MKTDNPTALCVAHDPPVMDLIRDQAAAKGMTPEDFVRALVQRALATERVERSESPTLEETRRAIRDGEAELAARLKEVERSDGAALAAERAVERRRG